MYQINPLGGVVRLSDGASIPEDPGNSDWQDYLAWIADGNTPSPPSAPNTAAVIDGIKAEAMQRITAIVPEYQQRNLLARATLLLRKGEANWTPEDQAAWAAGEAIWAQVDAIRQASDQMEAEILETGTATTPWPS